MQEKTIIRILNIGIDLHHIEENYVPELKNIEERTEALKGELKIALNSENSAFIEIIF